MKIGSGSRHDTTTLTERYLGSSADMLREIIGSLDEILAAGRATEATVGTMFFQFVAGDSQTTYQGTDINNRPMKIPGTGQSVVYVDRKLVPQDEYTVSGDRLTVVLDNTPAEGVPIWIAAFSFNDDGTLYFDDILAQDAMTALVADMLDQRDQAAASAAAASASETSAAASASAAATSAANAAVFDPQFYARKDLANVMLGDIAFNVDAAETVAIKRITTAPFDPVVIKRADATKLLGLHADEAAGTDGEIDFATYAADGATLGSGLKLSLLDVAVQGQAETTTLLADGSVVTRRKGDERYPQKSLSYTGDLDLLTAEGSYWYDDTLATNTPVSGLPGLVQVFQNPNDADNWVQVAHVYRFSLSLRIRDEVWRRSKTGGILTDWNEVTMDWNPVGTVIAVANGTVPDGYLECNGATISRTVYSDLFAQIAELYGVGDGTTTFQIPDLRGRFIRGWDNGAGVDVGRAIASYQDDDNKNHTHSFSATTGGVSVGHTHTYSGVTTGGGSHRHALEKQAVDTTEGLTGGYGHILVTGPSTDMKYTPYTDYAPTHTHSYSGTTSGHSADHTHTVSGNTGAAGSESRPKNAAMMYCIKY